jgi:hypothetical protein
MLFHFDFTVEVSITIWTIHTIMRSNDFPRGQVTGLRYDKESDEEMFQSKKAEGNRAAV